MKRISAFLMAALIMALAVAAVVIPAKAAPVTTDAIAGTWYGNMNFSSDNHVERIKFVIPSGCEPGQVCGSMQNYPARCTWTIMYDGFDGVSYRYHFASSLDGGCPAGSAGKLTLLSDGTLYREHTTPFFTAFGILDQRPFGTE